MCRDYKSGFKELLQIGKSLTINQENLQYLVIEIYKVKIGISPKIMNQTFRISKNSVYRLRKGIQLEKPSINTAQFGKPTIYLGAKTWKSTPENFVNANYARHMSIRLVL